MHVTSILHLLREGRHKALPLQDDKNNKRGQAQGTAPTG